MYKAGDLRERTLDDLKELEKSLLKDLFSARFKNFTNRLDDTSSLRKGRRDLARIKTVLLEKLRGVPVVAKPKPAKAAARRPPEEAPPAVEAAPEAAPSKPARKKAAAPKKKPAAKKSDT